MNIWFLVANASEAHLYEGKHIKGKDISLIKSFEHKESREKSSDLVSDQQGKYHTNHSVNSAYEASSPKTIETEKFARELCHYLDLERKKGHFDRLVLIAPPEFYGLINQSLNSHIEVMQHVAKDYTKQPKEALIELLQ